MVMLDKFENIIETAKELRVPLISMREIDLDLEFRVCSFSRKERNMQIELSIKTIEDSSAGGSIVLSPGQWLVVYSFLKSQLKEK